MCRQAHYSELPTVGNLAIGPEVLGVGIMILLEKGGETGEALEEGFVVLARGLRPLHLGEGRHTGQRLILYHLLVGHVLRPEARFFTLLGLLIIV